MASSKNLMNIQIGQLIMVEICNEILIGTLKYIDLKRKILELDDAQDQKTNYNYTSTQILALPQIRTIKILHDDNQPKEQENGNEDCVDSTKISSSSNDENAYQSASSNINSSYMQEQETLAVVELSRADFTQIQEHLQAITIIAQTDFRYHKAIADIQAQNVVSLLVEPFEFGRHRRTAIIAMATHHSVYIFDLVNLGKVFREMKDILRATRPRKVLHYSHKILDNLKHRHCVDIDGVFDTFVAHSLITGNKKPCSLIETLQSTFNVSEMYFKYEDENNLPFDPYRRPLSKAQTQYIAKLTVFQLKLYEFLLHERMLKNFYKQCSNFARTHSENDDTLEVAMSMQPQSRKGFEHIQHDSDWKKTLDGEF